jgi:hypothetical protein
MILRYNALLVLVAAFARLLFTVPAEAQTLYLDTNGDGLNGLLEIMKGGYAPLDVLTSQIASVEVYLVTDKDPDETTATCPTSAQPLTINSYEVLLRTSGNGAVTASGWTDNMGFETPFLPTESGTGFVTVGTDIGFGFSGDSKSPGAYRLGTLSVIVTGTPRLNFVTSSTVAPYGFTGFGSDCSGDYFGGVVSLGGDFPLGNAFGTEVATPIVQVTWGKIKQRYR